MFSEVTEYKNAAGFLGAMTLRYDFQDGSAPVDFTFRMIDGEINWSNDWCRVDDIPGIVQGHCEHLSIDCGGHTVWTGKTPE